MVVFSLFFGRLARVPSEGLPYPVFTYTALVPWTFFATALALIISVIAGLFGFSGIAAGAAQVAKIAFGIFLLIAVLAFLFILIAGAVAF